MWMSKATFGFVDGIREGNWGWATTQINLPQKNNNLSGIVAIGGGNANYTVFLDNAGNVFTCGSNQFGQLGLGDTQDRYTPQKVNSIPPIASLSSCNAALYYLQIVDWKGRVWGCGKNDGQLGLGHNNETPTFQPSNMIVRHNRMERTSTNNQTLLSNLESQAVLDKEEKDIFKSLEKEQNKQLMWKLKSNIHLQNVNKQQAKQKIMAGVIDMADWLSKWKEIHAKNQQLYQSIQQHKVNLNNKQQQLDELTEEVREIKQAISTIKEQKEVAEFFDGWLEPIAEAEEELKSGFEEKLNYLKRNDWTIREVSLFLNICGMGHLVTHQREKKIDGKVLEDAMEDVTVMEIKDKLTEKKMMFYLKVLESGKLMNKQDLSLSIVWRHRDVEKTPLLIKEWGIELDVELVRRKRISICELLYFNVKDFQKHLEVKERNVAMEMVRKMKKMRNEFEEFLASECHHFPWLVVTPF